MTDPREPGQPGGDEPQPVDPNQPDQPTGDEEKRDRA